MTQRPDRETLNHGFSLIELSIVLVVIGLLLGGVTAMRSYLRNAELTTMMNETKFYIDAFNKFQAKYNGPPGDLATASSMWSGAGNGDGNGLIRAPNTDPANALECYYAFQHLALAGFIPGSYTGQPNGNGGATAGVNVPRAAIDQGAYLFDHPNATDGMVLGDSLYPNGSYGNVLRVAGVNANSANVPDQPLLSGRQAFQLDAKYDDGGPYTGTIVAPRPTTLGNCTDDPNNYRTRDDKGCYLILKMQ